MTCHAVRRRLSAFLDGELGPVDARAVGAHIEACPACRERARGLRAISEALGDMTRLEAPPSVAQGVRDRIEMERRDPGLAHLFRSSWRARPLMLPSLIPAALVLVTVLAAALALDHDPLALRVERDASASWEHRYPPSGTEANPLLPVAGVSAPRSRPSPSGILPADALAEMEEGTLFLETVVARDGSVSAVNILEGNSHQAGRVLEALRRERFWPGQYNGRPVAVSVYRLISRQDVRAASPRS